MHCGASVRESAMESVIRNQVQRRRSDSESTGHGEVEKGVRDLWSSTGEEGVRQLKSSI